MEANFTIAEHRCKWKQCTYRDIQKGESRALIMPYGSVKTTMDQKEKEVRVKIHNWLLKKDKDYKRIEYGRVNEVIREVHVKWIDRNGESREDKFRL